jgi:pimeloyl-ACP methyl ester carboxylesterase
MKYFSSSYRMIAIDLPGHGKSAEYPDLSLESYSEAINQVIQHENPENYILAGHSMGGCLCLEHYIKNRERILAMILISTAPVLPVDSSFIENARNNFSEFFDGLLGVIFSKKTGIFILAAKENLTRTEQNVIINDLEICSRMNYESILPQIDIPVLLIANTNDKMVPCELTRAMHLAIKNSQFITFKENGHMSFFESPERFNAAVERFLNEILWKQRTPQPE